MCPLIKGICFWAFVMKVMFLIHKDDADVPNTDLEFFVFLFGMMMNLFALFTSASFHCLLAFPSHAYAT